MPNRIDTDAVRRDHPIEAVAAGYRITLRRSGRALVGRCPLHDDRRPSFHVYPAADAARDSWFCYGCGVGGDAIDLVGRLEGLPFLAAVARLCGVRPATPPLLHIRPARRPPTAPTRGPAERACVAAAADFYAGRLGRAPAALAYLASRGVDPQTIAAHRIGYAAGDGLADYLRWRRLPLAAARRAGLLRRDGAEHLAGRVVVPELRAGRAAWLIGRTLPGDPRHPVYLGLPGPKPLLGWGAARGGAEVWVVEGVYDWLTLRRWGFPAVALLGTRAGPAALETLRAFPVVYLALDADAAGRAATERLAGELGGRAITVPLPGAGDPAELAHPPGGPSLLRAAAARARLAPAA
jgi:DNA primase